MQGPEDLTFNKPRLPWLRLWLRYRFRWEDAERSELPVATLAAAS